MFNRQALIGGFAINHPQEVMNSLGELSIVTISREVDESLTRTRHSIEAIREHVEWIVILGPTALDNHMLAEEIGADRVHYQLSSGLYAAMNLGLRQSTRPFVWFLNGGDALDGPQGLRLLCEKICTSDASWGFGSLILQSGRTREFSPASYARRKSAGFANGVMPPQPATIYRRKDLEVIGGFDCSLAIAADLKAALLMAAVAEPVIEPSFRVFLEPAGVSSRDRFAAVKEIVVVLRELRSRGKVNLRLSQCVFSLSCAMLGAAVTWGLAGVSNCLKSVSGIVRSDTRGS